MKGTNVANEIVRVRLPLLVEQREVAGGISERIEVDFEQVLRNSIPMQEVGKLRLSRGDVPIPRKEADSHFAKVNRWGAGGSSVNDFIGGEVPKEQLGSALRRFGCFSDVVTYDDGTRMIDWEEAMPATRWIEENSEHCFDENKRLFLTVKNDGAAQMEAHRKAAFQRGINEIHLLAEDTYAPILSDSLFRGGPAEFALWNLSPLSIDSPKVLEFKRKARASEAGDFLSAVMVLVGKKFDEERQILAKLAKKTETNVEVPEHVAVPKKTVSASTQKKLDPVLNRTKDHTPAVPIDRVTVRRHPPRSSNIGASLRAINAKR